MTRYSAPIPSMLKKSDVWGLAERTASRLGFEVGDPLEPIVSALGGRIIFRDPLKETGKPEAIIVRSKSDFTIFLGNITSWERDRFTIAHELGHLLIHYPLARKEAPELSMKATRWVDEDDVQQKRAEWEANWFAAAFLMPASEFIRLHRISTKERLASQFAVSLSAVSNRSKSLSLEG